MSVSLPICFPRHGQTCKGAELLSLTTDPRAPDFRDKFRAGVLQYGGNGGQGRSAPVEHLTNKSTAAPIFAGIAGAAEWLKPSAKSI
jgi:hypothetical protein